MTIAEAETKVKFRAHMRASERKVERDNIVIIYHSRVVKTALMFLNL